jgi:DNA polymerase-3 subunit alpha
MLNIRSCFSISKSVIKIDELAKTCIENGLTYISICDEDLFSLPQLLTVAKSNHLKPVFGYRYKSDNGFFSFFIKTKKGYLTLIQFTNNKLSFEQLLAENDLITIFRGKKQAYQNLVEQYPNVYYGVDEETDFDNIENIVYFKTINVLGNDSCTTLDFLQKMSKAKQEELEPPESFENAIQKKIDEKFKTAFTHIQNIVDDIQEFDLTVDYKLPVLSSKENEHKLLYERCFEKLKEKGLHENERYQKRLEYEYSVIKEKGFSRYLLLAADIVDTAKELGAWVGPGRGSAVSSLLVFLLGITQADPIKNGLIFERFLSIDRDDEPDIDIDVEDEMRQEILSALRQKYSKERMVHIITFGTYGQKLVKRELSKYFQIDQKELLQEKYQNMISEIIGLPHHVSTHAAGIIFSQNDLRDMIPLRELTEDSLMTQYDMNALKECGLFKMDILGLITLSTLKKMGIPFETLDTKDENVYQSIRKDNLSGIFQLDSKTGRKLTNAFTPHNFDEIRILISINRPGPSQSGLTDELIERRSGSKKVEYYHPLVKEILSKTWGVPIYQEQIMEMSMKLAGFSAKQANKLRKAMAKKEQSLMNKLKTDFIEGAYENDMEKIASEELFDMMAEFAGYAFNKAHATAYGLITFWTAYTKYHKPLQFYKTLIDANHGKNAKLYNIINEARQNGIKILAPDINMSDSETKIENDTLHLGFNLIKDINTMTVSNILAERQRDSYTSIEDFILRIDKNILSDFILKRLMEAHVFESLSDKMSLDDMIKIRDKNAKTLEKIGAKLFGEVPNNNEEKKKKDLSKNDLPNLVSFIQEEINSYGFVINVNHVFGLSFNPFVYTDLNVGLVMNKLKANRYEINNGLDFSVINPSKELKEGTIILFLKHRNESRLKGYVDHDKGEILISQNHFSGLEKIFSEKKEKIRKAGLKKIKVFSKKYNLEVLL